MIRFVLGNEVVERDDLDPATTVLDWLRDQGRVGTKEGCASGDCGACTVAIATPAPDGDGLAVDAVNSCIALVGSLDGCALVTVEDLADPAPAPGADDLHPVQRAMVDQHGSQCGFCTPGFVMSMFAWAQGDPTTDRHDIDTALSGNLCRCTGYRPIVAAARQVATGPRADRFADHADALRDRLDDLAATRRTDGMATLATPDATWCAPTTLAQAVEALAAHDDATIVAGGTDLALEVTQSGRRFAHLVDVTRVAELHAVEVDGEVVTIGAGVPLSRAQQVLEDVAPATATLWHRYGSVPIRNRATLGGNLATASPIGDAPPVLLALDATVVVAGPDGVRSIAVDDFFVDYRQTAMHPGELLVAIEIPRPTPLQHLSVSKVSKRLDDDISAVCGAVNLTVEDATVTAARVAFGGMAATPSRAHGCEAALVGNRVDDDTLAAARVALADDFAPIDDMRASASYRATVAANLLTRAFLELDGVAVRVSQV